jgi:predicted dehydrogenase
MSKTVFSVSVIGIGSMAQTIHLPMIKSFAGKFELKSIIDPHLPEKELMDISQKFGCSYSSSIDDAESDLAVIVTPISTHFPLAKKAMAKNKHILIEKALTESLANLNNLIEEEKREQGRRLFCAHMRRFYKNVNIAKIVVSNGLLGDIEQIKIFEGNLYGWNRKFFAKDRDRRIKNIDEGVLFDVGSHGIDSVAYILGNNLSNINIESSVVDSLDIMSDINFTGTCSLSNQNNNIKISGSFSNTTSLSNVIWIIGEKASLMISPNDAVKPKLKSRNTKEFIETDISWNVVNPFYTMYETVYNSIVNQTKSILDIENFVNTTQILESSFTQATEGQIDWI